MKHYLNLSLICAFSALTLAATACGSSANSGGGGTTDTTSGTDTATGTDTTSGADTSTNADTMPGDMMVGDGTTMGDGQGGGDGSNDPCQPCLQSKCATALGACAADATCSSKMSGIGDCLKAAGSDATAAQKCLTDFAATGTPASDMVTCVQTNCKTECL